MQKAILIIVLITGSLALNGMNERNSYIDTCLNRPLLQAAKSHAVETVKDLLEENADVNYQDESSGNTALHLAARYGNPGICRFLIENGANLYLVNKKGRTPLTKMASREWADQNFQQRIASLLIEAMILKELKEKMCIVLGYWKYNRTPFAQLQGLNYHLMQDLMREYSLQMPEQCYSAKVHMEINKITDNYKLKKHLLAKYCKQF